MSDFSDRLLVAGTFVGVRSFAVDSLGRLTGVVYQAPWTPGVNTAVCDLEGRWQRALAHTFGFPAGTLVMSSTLGRGRATPAADLTKKHPAATLDCTCGWYAYFDGGHNPHHRDGQVLGLVEGFGRVTAGSRGFRAEKARIVALVDNRRGLSSWREHSRWLWLNVLLAVWCAAWTLAYVVLAEWWSAGIFVGLTAVNVMSARAEARRTWRRNGRSRLPASVRANYPDVPVYRSLRAALAAHPPTPPPPHTPDTDPEFWTRSST